MPCGLSVLRRTYPEHELAGVEPASEIPTQTAKTLMNGGQIGCRHFAATAKQKGVTFARNPLFYLVGWRSLNNSRNTLL
ncbi:hypothetical protein EYJ46_13690 [Salmonella enterica]|nr:hypothetical protein [Salmonella enterica]